MTSMLVQKEKLLKILATWNDGQKIFGSSNFEKSSFCPCYSKYMCNRPLSAWFLDLSFLEASRFFWVSTLLLITVSIWFATHAWLCWCWVLALAEKGPSARMMRTRIGMIGMKTKKMKRWERHTCHNRCTHPLGCWVMHQRWGGITCEVRRILPWCYPKKLWCSICFKSGTSFYHPTYPSLSLTSEVGKLSDLHISPRIHMYQNTQTYIRTLFCHIRDSIYRDNIEWIM